MVKCETAILNVKVYFQKQFSDYVAIVERIVQRRSYEMKLKNKNIRFKIYYYCLKGKTFLP